MTLRNINDFRLIEPAKSWYWDLQFPDAPYPFNEFFPAIDVSLDLFNLSSFSQEVFLNNLNTPQKGGTKKMSITFFDDAALSLESFFEDWVQEEILNGGEYISTIQESVKQVRLRMLDNKREIVKQRTLWVYPEGTLQFKGNSESAISNTTLEFVVAGEIPVS